MRGLLIYKDEQIKWLTLDSKPKVFLVFNGVKFKRLSEPKNNVVIYTEVAR